MRRFPQQQQLNDFQLNNFAEKIPIHYRSSSKKSVTPTTMGPRSEARPPVLYVEESEAGSRGSSAQGHGLRGHHKHTALLPGDRIIVTENPSAPGVPVVYRTPDERASNPDRLNLDRRKLTVCPLLEGEEHLRLLNCQHNFITQIQHISSLRRLIFLDLYDNHIGEISGLSALKLLRVLMLGKNRIKKIENLDSLLKLDVLDLHGNQISKIENLNHLSELRVLNLAGNLITHVDELVGVYSLAELNLRRNKIQTVAEINTLPHLQRLFLSFNNISSFEDIQCVEDSSSLCEISLDGNPLSQDPGYRQSILRHMHQLKQLDMKHITEEERRVAVVMARKEEEKKREINKLAILKERRCHAINNAKRQWEMMQSSAPAHTSHYMKSNPTMPELFASHVGSVPNSELISPHSGEPDALDIESFTSSDMRSRPSSAHSTATTDLDNAADDGHRDSVRNATRRLVEARLPQRKGGGGGGDAGPVNNTIIWDGVNMLEQIEGDTLSLYGPQSLEAFDRNWGIQAAGVVNVIIFKYIDFNAIVKQLPKIRVRFPATQTLVFCSTNIHSLQQINALSLVRRLDNLTIELDGNPVTKFTLWRMYTLFRLAHFALKKINDVEVSSSDVANAEKLFGALSHVATSSLPQYLIFPDMGDGRRRHGPVEGKKQTEGGKPGLDKPQAEMVGRTWFMYAPAGSRQESGKKRNFAHNMIANITKETIFNDRKRSELIKIWPGLIIDMVRDAMSNMADMETYMKRSLEAIEKG